MDPISNSSAAQDPDRRAGARPFFDFLTDQLRRGSSTRSADGDSARARRAGRLAAGRAAGAAGRADRAGIAWYLQRSWKLAVAVALGLLFIINQGLWKETVETLVLVRRGGGRLDGDRRADRHLGRAHRPRSTAMLQPVLDLMQTMPTFVYLIPVLILFGLGIAPGLIVTVIFAIPAPIRLTHLGITSVPKPMIEAGEAFGATKRQLLWKVELPARAADHHGRGSPSASCCRLSMVVIAALIGAGGLGKPVGARARTRVNDRRWASRPASPSSSSPSSSTASSRIGSRRRE